ncbi:hypothetical protein PRIPAC_80841 [Pristionchus pacificus]|uniref:Long-chain-fatty-acid--CoA ligase n=1 Tax=Pristionchus pacificus TaxID=54126 RepID=A0A2A6C3N1_PRIPA|nr:hypothetical protein PRIPAC_80841 [Pristionchus pacificus]|eukprot:PDM72740.1 AMP-binding protein [Pristionchus pacificus]
MDELAIVGAASAAAIGLGYYMTSGGEGKIEPLVDPLKQTKKLPDGSRISRYIKDGVLLKYLFDDATTLYEVLSRVDNVAVAFRELGLPTGEDTFIGIYSRNRVEWVITELATYSYSNVIVPLYDTLGPDASAFIINQTGMKIVVCEMNAKAIGLLQQREHCPSLSIIVVMDIPSQELRTVARHAGIKVISFSELEDIGKNAQIRPDHVKPTPETLATICYTSGTTGTPKGVMLTHANVIADATTVIYCQTTFIDVTDVMISFLPLAHMLERVFETICYMVGARVGFYRGDIRLLPEDIKVMSEVNKSFLKKTLFNVALAYKEREMKNFVVRNNSFFDQIVFKKIREGVVNETDCLFYSYVIFQGMGGNVKLMITGSAPLENNVLTFVRAAMGCVVIEGYGQTECVAAATVSMEGDSIPGHVGMPCPCVAIKLVDVPELGYFAKDDAGEVCVRGHTIFKGYYKNEEQTREVLDSEGWLHTGDIGRWTKEGCLKIVDRKKHIFKLAQGEYVAPEKIESIYTRCKFVAQSFVYGESFKSCLIAIVVPDVEVLVPEMESIGIKGTMEELCVRDDVKDIYLECEPFSVENGLLTPTLKSKRPKLQARYEKELATMYSNLN